MLFLNTLFHLLYLGNSIHWTNTNVSNFAISLIIDIIELSKILH